jgi:hypothetical protein
MGAKLLVELHLMVEHVVIIVMESAVGNVHLLRWRYGRIGKFCGMSDHFDEFATAEPEVDVLIVSENLGEMFVSEIQRMVDISIKNGGANFYTNGQALMPMFSFHITRK